jgi:hypothetical protein
VTEADVEKIESNPGMMQSIGEHQEVPKVDALRKPDNGRKKHHKGQKQTAERCGELKELTRGDCGSWRKFAGACRKVSCHATVSWCKRNIIRNKWTRVKAERGIQMFWKLREKVWTCHEGRRVVKDLGSRWLRYLRK